MRVPKTSRTLKQRLNKYSAEQLSDCLDYIFGEGCWSNIKKYAKRSNLDLTSPREIVHYAVSKFEAKKPSQNLRMKTSLNVLGFDIVWHNKSAIWYGAVFHEKTPNHMCDPDNFENNIIKAYKEHGINADGIMFSVDSNRIFMTIAPKHNIKGKTSITYSDTFSIYLDIPTLDTENLIALYLPQGGTKTFIDHFEILGSALGYGSCERLNLHGCNVDNLLPRIRNYQEKSLQVQRDISFQVCKPVGNRNAVDFTQGKARMQYADRLLPREQDTFKDYRVTCTRESGRGLMATMEVNVHSNNHTVEDVFRGLIYHNYMDVPAPAYVESMPYECSNDVVIQPGCSQKRSLEAEDRYSNKSNKKPALHCQEFYDEWSDVSDEM